MFDYFDITTIVSGLTVAAIAGTFTLIFFREWLWGLVKKDKPNTEPNPDTDKEFSAKQVNLLLTEQAREASGFESNKPKTINPAQKKILFDELNKLEQGLTDFKKLLQDM